MVQKKLPLINSSHGSETRNIINELIKLFNGMGYTYDEALNMAKNVLREAKQTNDKNIDTNSRLNKIIGELTSDAEVIDARGNHPVLKNRLDDVKENFTLDGWELQNKRREVKPLVTFIDDDGRIDVLTKLKPLSEKYAIPFTVAAYVRSVEDESIKHYMNKEDLLHLQNDLGWEISSHTYTHSNLSTLTDEQQEYELKHSKEVLESWGIKVTTICYPYDGRNKATYDLTRKYYRSGRRTGGAVNTVPLETFEIRSTTLGSWFESSGGTLESYKSRVDEAIEKNGWVIFMTHVADPNHDDTQQRYLEETIKYVQSKNIDIVTYDEGLNRMGNIVDIGNYGRDNLDRKHFVIGADGSVAATEVQDTVRKTKVNEINKNTKPSSLKHGYIYHTRISTSESESGGYPSTIAGNLTTVTTSTFNAGLEFTYQEYRPRLSSDVFIRSAKNDDTWGDWQKLNGGALITIPNSFSATSKPSEFTPRKVTYTQISGSNSPGFPTDSAGILITSIIATNSNAYNFQEFHVYNTNKKYKRMGTTGDSWSEWSDDSNYVEDLGKNNVTASQSANTFPQGKISYSHITLVSAAGFPENKAGVLMSNCLYSVAGYRHQEYDVQGTGQKFKRYEKTDGTWSDWKEFQMV